MNLDLEKNFITGIKMLGSNLITVIVLLPVIFILSVLSFGIDIILGILSLIFYLPASIFLNGFIFNWINKRFK